MAKMAHESTSFVNIKELQRVKKAASTQGLLDAFATPRTSKTSQSSPYGSDGPSQRPVEFGMGFVHVEEADKLAQDKLEDSCAGLRDMQDPYRDEPAAKLAQQTQSLRKSSSWAAALLKDQIKETTEMGNNKQNQHFAAANDKGDVWSIDEQWGQIGDAIVFAEEEPQAYGKYEIKSMDDFKVQLRNAHDTLFYQATGLNDFTDEHRLGVNILRELYGEPMATKVLQTAEGATGEGNFTTRPEVREMLMYLLYFGIG
jgi:hypothetical protein